MAILSQAQEQALEKVGEILREHFEAHVLVIESEVDDHGEQHRVGYAGGWSRARGLTLYAQEYLKDGGKRNSED